MRPACPNGGAVVTGATGAVVTSGAETSPAETQRRVGETWRGTPARWRTPVQRIPTADFVLTDPLGRVVPGLPGVGVEGLVAPPIDVAVAPPGAVAAEPAIDVVVDSAMSQRFSCRGGRTTRRCQRAGTERSHDHSNRGAVGMMERHRHAASSVVRPTPIYGQEERFVQILTGSRSRSHRRRSARTALSDGVEAHPPRQPSRGNERCPRKAPGAEITSRKGGVVTKTSAESPTEDDMTSTRERAGDCSAASPHRGTPAPIRSL